MHGRGDHERARRKIPAPEESIMNLIVVWIIVGGGTGLLAGMLLSRVPMGLVGAVVTGIAGGVLGGLAFGLMNLPIAPGIFTNVGVAFVGSVLLLALAQKLL
jgi:uncharacterized membrane protein YeaQ/YmgE (transglycosylase-associated protein family)